MHRAGLVVVGACGSQYVKLEPARVAAFAVGLDDGTTHACLHDGAAQLR